MPSWKIHRLVDRILFGREYSDVHYFLDHIGVILNNGIKGHRKVWGHKPIYALLVYHLTKDKDRMLSALMHMKIDKEIDYKKSKKLEILLKLMGLL